MKDSKSNIEQEAPILFALKKERDLAIPKGYFEQKEKELLRIPRKKNNNSKIWITYSLAFVASLLLLFYINTKNNNSNRTYKQELAQLTAEDLELDLLLDDNDDELSSTIDFNDAEELLFLKNELQKPILKVEIKEEDFDSYFDDNEDDDETTPIKF